MKFCSSYVGLSCVDGSCPIALQEQYADLYEDSGYPVIKNCKECHRYFGWDACALRVFFLSCTNKKIQDCINAYKKTEKPIK